MMVSEDDTPLRHYADVYTAIYGVLAQLYIAKHTGLLGKVRVW